MMPFQWLPSCVWNHHPENRASRISQLVIMHLLVPFEWLQQRTHQQGGPLISHFITSTNSSRFKVNEYWYPHPLLPTCHWQTPCEGTQKWVCVDPLHEGCIDFIRFRQ